jgi:hypothetical protein
MSPDICDQRRLLAFLSGGLEGTDAADLDVHLLACEPCWAAVVEDRRGREAAEALREDAPGAVRDRLDRALAAARPAPRRNHRGRAALAAVMAAIAAATSAMLVGRGATTEPRPLAAVLRLSGPGAKLPARAGTVQVWRARSAAGGEVVVAESPDPFAMPAGARAVRIGGSQGWVARRGRVHVLCLMSPRHALLAGPVPDGELTSVARAYGLVS